MLKQSRNIEGFDQIRRNTQRNFEKSTWVFRNHKASFIALIAVSEVLHNSSSCMIPAKRQKFNMKELSKGRWIWWERFLRFRICRKVKGNFIRKGNCVRSLKALTTKNLSAVSKEAGSFFEVPIQQGVLVQGILALCIPKKLPNSC